MRLPIPLLAPAAEVPDQPGLELLQPRGRCGPSAWLEAQLCLPLELLARTGDAWLPELHVTAITSVDQIPRIGAPFELPLLTAPAPWAVAGELAALHMRFDLAAVLGPHPLHAEPLYVHASCGTLCSRPVPLPPVELDPPEAAAPDPAQLDEHSAYLQAAYTLASLGEHGDALAMLEALFDARPSVRADVDACHLYNAACLYARLGQGPAAYLYLREDAARRVDAYTAARLSCYGPDDAELEAALVAGLRGHFELALRDDDLRHLGEARTLAALLGPPPAPPPAPPADPA